MQYRELRVGYNERVTLTKHSDGYRLRINGHACVYIPKDTNCIVNVSSSNRISNYFDDKLFPTGSTI